MWKSFLGTRMRAVTRRQDSLLHDSDIDRLSEWLREATQEAAIDSRDALRARILMEEVLLSMQGRLGIEQEVRVAFESRLGRACLRLEADGEPYNPLTDEDALLGEWGNVLGTAIGVPTQYSHVGGTNIVRFTVSTEHANPVMRLGTLAVLGMLAGLLGNLVLPDATDAYVSGILLTPLYEMWLRLLSAISGPIVFLTVTTTMLDMRRVDAKGGDSRRSILRYFGLSLLAVMFATMVVGGIHPLQQSELHMDADLVGMLIGNVLSVVPSNIFDPFIESNTAQLLFLAFALGYLLTRLGSGADMLRRGVLEANSLGLKTAEWVSWLVPIFVAVLMCLEIVANQTGVLAGIWRPLGLSLAVSATGMLFMLVCVSMRMGVSPLLLAQKLTKPFIVALRTGSLDRSFDELLDSNAKLLGIDRSYSQEAAPQGLVLYMPVSAIGTIVFTIYVAQAFGVQSTPVWYATAIVMAVVVFVATPPVPGANLLAYVVLFSALGISSNALIDAMIFDVLFGIFAGAANQAMLQLEMLMQADHLGLLDSDRMRAPVRRVR